MPPIHEQQRYFVVIPLFTVFIWFSTLLAMLLTWLISGRPKYVSTQVAVVYISDVSATFLKPLWAVACIITGTGLVLCVTIERLLRHRDRLPPELRAREHLLSRLSIGCAVVAMCCLVLQSGFDTGDYPIIHKFFFIAFMFGVAFSAIFTVVEYRWLTPEHAEIKKLKRSYIAKGAIGIALVVLAIVFGVTAYESPDVGGVIDWILGFGLTFYLLTYVYDLRMAKVVEVSGVSKEEKIP